MYNHDLVTVLEHENRRLRNAMIELHAKAEAYDNLMGAEGVEDMNVVAKVLGVGRNKLLRFLREDRVLAKNGTPYQRYMNRGFFKVRLKTYWKPNTGNQKIPVTLVSPKGVDFIHRRLQRSDWYTNDRDRSLHNDYEFEWYLKRLDEFFLYGGTFGDREVDFE